MKPKHALYSASAILMIGAAALAPAQTSSQSSSSKQQPARTASAEPIAGVIPLGVTQIEADLITPGLRASKLLKQRVYNDKGEKIGEVDDIVVSPDGKLTAAVIEVGGFLGLGKKRVAIPVTQFASMHPKVTLPGATKDALKQLPEFIPA